MKMRGMAKPMAVALTIWVGAIIVVLGVGALLERPVGAQGYQGGPRWECSLDAVTSNTRCASAPGDGTTIYVDTIIMTNTTATNALVTIVAGTGTNCATSSVAVLYSSPTLGTNRLAVGEGSGATGPPRNEVLSLKTPLKVPRDKDVCFGSTQAVTVQMMGYLAP